MKRPCRKVRHTAWGTAAAERDRLQVIADGEGRPDRYRAYHCAACKSFHVGRLPEGGRP